MTQRHIEEKRFGAALAFETQLARVLDGHAVAGLQRLAININCDRAARHLDPNAAACSQPEAKGHELPRILPTRALPWKFASKA